MNSGVREWSLALYLRAKMLVCVCLSNLVIFFGCIQRPLEAWVALLVPSYNAQNIRLGCACVGIIPLARLSCGLGWLRKKRAQTDLQEGLGSDCPPSPQV